MINRQAAAYWIPAFAGMTIGRGCKSGPLRMRAQVNVTRRVIAREGGRSSIAEELMINRQAAAYWIPAFAGMTAGPTTNAACLRMRAQRSEAIQLRASCFASRWFASLRSQCIETVCRWPRMGPPVRAEDLGTGSSQTHIGAAQTRTQTSRQAIPMRYSFIQSVNKKRQIRESNVIPNAINGLGKSGPEMRRVATRRPGIRAVTFAVAAAIGLLYAAAPGRPSRSSRCGG